MAKFNLKEEGRYNTPGFKLNKTSSIKRDWLQKDDQGEIKTSMVGKRDQSGITHPRIQTGILLQPARLLVGDKDQGHKEQSLSMEAQRIKGAIMDIPG